jgi:hypothetical protein
MQIPTRMQLIQQKKWPTVDVETEAGPITVAGPAAEAPLRIRELRAMAEQLRAGGVDVEREVTAEMLRFGCVDADGAPLFPTTSDAKKLLACITPASMERLLKAFTKLMMGGEAGEEASLGNSGGGPSAASPSASAASSGSSTPTTSSPP